MAWQKIYDITPPGGSIRNIWTRAIVQNRLFLFHQTNPFILEVDTSVPGSVTIIEHVDTGTFLNLAAIQGIFEARSRLGAWDSDNSHYWSDTADVLNFTPDIRTRANAVKVDAVKGNIIYVLGSTEGFITYTTANIVGATYDRTAQKVFNFFEIADNLGVFSDYSITKANDGTHFAWTNGGLYQITNQHNGAEPFATEVADYLTSFQQAPRLSHHLNRYLAVWLHDEGIEFARTIRQRNFSDAATYWRQQFAYDDYPYNQALFLEALTPDGGYPFNDGYPLGCYPEVPVAACFPESAENTLWAMATEEYPIFQLEKLTVTSVDFIDAGGPTNFLPRYIDPITNERVDAAPYSRDIWTFTEASFDDIKANHKGFTIIPLLRFSFDAHELLMYQCYLWQAQDNANLEHLQTDQVMNSVISATANERFDHNLISRGPLITISDTTIVDSTIIEDSRIGVYELVTELQGNVWVDTNVRLIQIEDGAANTRQTIIQSYTVRHDASPIVVIESPSDGGARDGEIQSGPTPDVVSASGIPSNQGLLYLAEQSAGSWEIDSNFEGSFQDIQGVVDAAGAATDNNRAFFEVFALGDRDYLSGIDYQLWSTASTLAATTDRCSYANVRNFTKNRATTDTTVTRTITVILRYVGDNSNGDSVYIRVAQQDIDVDYDIDRLWPDLLNAPGVLIPLKVEKEAVPLAEIVKANGANPGAIIKPYYDDSVALGIDIRQVYANNGWTVLSPPSAAAHSPPNFLQASPPTGNWYNGTDPSGTFEEFFSFGLQCGKLTRGVWPFDIIPFSPEPLVIPTLPDLTGPETIFLTQTGAPGQYYPIWDRVLIYDRLLQMWGTCDIELALFIDFSPVNEVTYDPVLEEAVTRFTYDNFLSRLGAVLENGVTVQWDDSPEDSYIIYGKIGWRRSRMTMMTEVFLEFAENPAANIILESSLDRRTLDPYNMRSEPVVRAGHTWYGTIAARWFNILVRGTRWHLTGLEFEGTPLGKE